MDKTLNIIIVIIAIKIIKTLIRYPYSLKRIPKIKRKTKLTLPNVGKDVEELELSYLAMSKEKW